MRVCVCVCDVVITTQEENLDLLFLCSHDYWGIVHLSVGYSNLGFYPGFTFKFQICNHKIQDNWLQIGPLGYIHIHK